MNSDSDTNHVDGHPSPSIEGADSRDRIKPKWRGTILKLLSGVLIAGGVFLLLNEGVLLLRVAPSRWDIVIVVAATLGILIALSVLDRFLLKSVGWKRAARVLAVFVLAAVPSYYLGVFAEYRTFDVKLDMRGQDRFMEIVLPQADLAGNVLVTCRSLVNSKGELIAQAARSRWTPLLPMTVDRIVESCKSVQAIIVFVHGYNTNLYEAVENGTGLLRNLQAAMKTHQVGPDPSNVLFVTFCWRGDFGAEKFGTANASAVASAASLAAFVEKIREHAPTKTKMILLGHSLGSKVSLEAMSEIASRRNTPLFDCVLLMQAAIKYGSIFKGEYDGTEYRKRGPEVDTVTVRKKFQGEYFQAVAATKSLLYTTGQDSVLMDLFPASRFQQVHLPRSRDPEVALGNSFEKEPAPDGQPWRGVHPRITAIHLHPLAKAKVSISEHSPIFKEDNKEIVAYLWQMVVAQTAND